MTTQIETFFFAMLSKSSLGYEEKKKQKGEDSMLSEK